MTISSSPTSAHPSTNRPVVLQVLPALEAGGVERGTVDMALFLKAAGGFPVVASEGGKWVHELERAGIPHITLPLASKNPLVMRANIRRLEALIRQYKVDIVHARSRAPAWSAFFAAKRTGAKFMTTFHAAYKYTKPIKKFYNSVMARGERVIAISGFIAQHIVGAYGVAPERVRTVPRGIDLFKFHPDTVTSERMFALAKNWRLPDGLKVIMCPGRLTRIKGHTVLLEALSKLERRDFICLMVGTDQGRTEYSNELSALVHQYKLEGHVSMVGDTNDMPVAYMLADVVVTPSIVPEGFGRTPVEAQAMGRPVIASAIGGMVETLLDGETGWLVQPGSADELAAAINAALDLTSEQRQRLAARAISFVHENFTKDRMGWQTLDVYAELYGQPVPWTLSGI